MSRLSWLKHAFAVETSSVAEPTPAQRAVVERLCQIVVSRGMAAPALLFLESARPLGYLGSQALHFFAPVISALGDAGAARELATFLEHRGAIDYLCQRIEALARSADGA
jgi:hypothetical protein